MTGTSSSPPKHTDKPIEVSPEDWEQRDYYYLMTSLVIPRPIGWISTVSEDGTLNVAPHSYFNMMGSDPFYIAFGSHNEKDTVSNLRKTPQFVANIVSMDLLEKMNFTATNFPPGEDEFSWSGLTPAPSTKVKPPRVGEAKAHLECEVVQIIDDRHTHIVLGRVVHAHVDPSVWRDGRVDPKLLDPACRLSGSSYAGLGELVNIPRASWSKVEGTSGQEAMPGKREKS
jgi:flavin reductase (DIM6/NTAB) family NADH-FMN oxidoreductase RutF